MLLRNWSLLRRSAGMLSLLLVSACQTPTVTHLAAFNCASYVPDTVAAATPGATMPDPVTADKTRWQVFGLEQTGQLDKANVDKRTIFSIVSKCNAREAEVAKALAPRTLWQQLTPWRE